MHASPRVPTRGQSQARIASAVQQVLQKDNDWDVQALKSTLKPGPGSHGEGRKDLLLRRQRCRCQRSLPQEGRTPVNHEHRRTRR